MHFFVSSLALCLCVFCSQLKIKKHVFKVSLRFQSLGYSAWSSPNPWSRGGERKFQIGKEGPEKSHPEEMHACRFLRRNTNMSNSTSEMRTGL